MNAHIEDVDPDLDLLFERIVDLPPSALWAAWTTPELLKRWFTPAPWKTIDCSIDLRAGGVFRTVMASPEGQTFDNAGCYLDVASPGRLVWTNALLPGFRPVTTPDDKAPVGFHFTACVTFTTFGPATRYSAHVMHGNALARKQHQDMGFHAGWGQALDQLLALMKRV